ncbi:MAG: hypothetical protein DRO11_05700 [Methanobacteriota archaeon]|nr:MAG: hypothetical protein DRO11_05700 [Euryarchaeota archaeon]
MENLVKLGDRKMLEPPRDWQHLSELFTSLRHSFGCVYSTPRLWRFKPLSFLFFLLLLLLVSTSPPQNVLASEETKSLETIELDYLVTLTIKKTGETLLSGKIVVSSPYETVAFLKYETLENKEVFTENIRDGLVETIEASGLDVDSIQVDFPGLEKRGEYTISYNAVLTKFLLRLEGGRWRTRSLPSRVTGMGVEPPLPRAKRFGHILIHTKTEYRVLLPPGSKIDGVSPARGEYSFVFDGSNRVTMRCDYLPGGEGYECVSDSLMSVDKLGDEFFDELLSKFGLKPGEGFLVVEYTPPGVVAGESLGRVVLPVLLRGFGVVMVFLIVWFERRTMATKKTTQC